MDIVVEKGNVDVGNTAEPSYEVVARSGCSAQLSTNDTDEHELGKCYYQLQKTKSISSDADMVKQNQQDALDTLIRISQHKKPKKLNVARVVSEDYKCTPEDVQLIEYIKTLPGKQVVVNIDSAWLNRNDMECLFHGDMQLSDNALNAYIHCIRGEEHLLHREGGKVFLENTFISSLLKRDGDPKVFLPMNIEDFHWYLAVLNAKKSELKGLERQIKLAAKHKELYQGKWSNLDVASWPVIEKITTQMQTDGVSCGLWMINYMEYWTGSSLSDNVTQDDITMFRFKLPAILWDSRLNTKKGHQNLDHNVDEDGESSSDVQIIDTPCELSKSSNTSHQIEPYISPYVLPAKVTSTNTQELMFVLCTYIMGIDNDKYLKKHWIQSTKPYPISLSLQKLKDILDVNKPMDTDCFNMAVRMIACNDSLFLLEDKYHYMDLQFCSITKFGRDPRLRAKPDINMLAKLLECWPDMEYDVSDCKQILLPFSFLGHFTLYVLNMDTRSIYIMDSMPIPSWFKGDHPSMHYIHNIHYIANNMNAAMELANPTWKDDIYMWRRIVPTWVPRTLNWDLSGFLVINFMHDWNGIRLPCICTNGNDLRTKFLVELLKYKDNESKDNIPEEIQEIIRHIR
ncbi:hypothetical protein ZEAMMB73_Zm00001d000326 [Zea mays]|nr:hypothetical protein ZEAMMB73_Zm00001d000326 [Zea mays]